ncbi:hypothetical protein V2A60_006511 [Cordyceps javanica]
MDAEPAKGFFAAHAPLIASWKSTPIPSLSLSAGGLLALADLGTVARRTVVAGGASWLDVLVLAPGLHYQQAADALEGSAAGCGGGGGGGEGLVGVALATELGLTEAVETGPDGTEVRRHAVRNVATVNYLERLLGVGDGDPGGGKYQQQQQQQQQQHDAVAEGSAVTICVGMARHRNEDEADRMLLLRRALAVLLRRRRRLRRTRQEARRHDGVLLDVDRLSHALYVLSPLLTVAATTLMVLLRDWWGLSFILALMLSRALNILTIIHRSRPPPPTPPPPSPPTRAVSPPPSLPPPPPDRNREEEQRQQEREPTEYVIELGPRRRRVVLRGRADDLQAVTARAWLRGRTARDGYCEAAGKLLVYGVAACSGNLTQAGALVLMALLLLSAALLGLSNAHARGLRMHGRVARPLGRPRRGDRRRPQGQAQAWFRRKAEDDEDEDVADLEQGRRDGFPVEDVRGR